MSRPTSWIPFVVASVFGLPTSLAQVNDPGARCVAVIPPEVGGGAGDAEFGIVSESLIKEYRRLGAFSVISPSEVILVLSELVTEYAGTCDKACRQQFYRVTGCRFGVSAKVDLRDGHYALGLSIADHHRPDIAEKPFDVETYGSHAALRDAVRQAVRLVHPEVPAPLGETIGPPLLGAAALSTVIAGLAFGSTMQSLQNRNAAATPAQYFEQHNAATGAVVLFNVTAIAAGLLAGAGLVAWVPTQW